MALLRDGGGTTKKAPAPAKAPTPAKVTPISADAAERKINAARDKAIADVKKSPTSADAAERRINNAVAKATAEITGKAAPKPIPTPVIKAPAPTTVKPSTPVKQPDPPKQKPPATVKTPAPIINPIVDMPSYTVYPEPQPIIYNDSRSYVYSEPATPPVKSAPIDTVVFIDEAFSQELMVDLLFEDIGGQEILSIARNDTVNGQSVIYQPIKNLNILQESYNSNNLLRLQETSDRFFANFIINLSEKIPKVGSGANGVNYFLDLAKGEGVIELVNMRSDERVEIQIASAGIIEDIGI
jgi:hypothetical protein